MNESRYIHQLNAALGPLEFQERESILQDYRQHFRDGRAEGLSDEAIAAALGAPEAVAAAYLEDWSPAGYPPPSPRRSRKSTILLAAGATLVVVLLVVGLGIAISTGGGFGTAEAWIEATSVVVERPLMPVAPTAPAAPTAPTAPQLSQWPLGSRAIGADELKQLRFTESFQGITSITVEGDYQLGCTVRHSGDDAVKVELSGRIPQVHDITVSVSGGLLSIVYEDNGWNVTMSNDYYPYVTLYLPAGVELDTLSIETMSGLVIYDPFGAPGQAYIHNLVVDTLSGAITLSASREDLFRFDSLLMDSMSGAITVSYMGDFQSAALSTVSGAIVADFTGEGEIEASTISGAISLTAQPGSIEVSSVSGSILLQLANGEHIKVYCASISGIINNQMNGGNTSSAIRCETVSGSITVRPTP